MLFMFMCAILIMYWTGSLTWSHVGWLLLTVLCVKPLQNLGSKIWSWWNRFFWLSFLAGARLAIKAGRNLTSDEKAELQRRLREKFRKEILADLEEKAKKNAIDLEGILK